MGASQRGADRDDDKAALGRRRVLFVTPTDPATVTGGGGTATRNIIELLRDAEPDGEVRIFLTGDLPAWIPHRARQLLAVAQSLVSPFSSKTCFACKPGRQAALARLCAEQDYDLVVFNGGELFDLSRAVAVDTEMLGVAHNVEYRLFEQLTQSWRRSWLGRLIFDRDVARLRTQELRGAVRIRNLVCLSESDATAFRDHDQGIRILTLSTSFAYPAHRRVERPRTRPLALTFLARYSWWPNQQAVEWLINDVFPMVDDGAVELHLFGPGAERFEGAHPAVRVRGFVEDLADVWNATDIMVCPMVSGSGINIKFVEAIYNGCPVVATPRTADGLPAIDDPAVRLMESAEDWARFLGGADAEALAARTPDPATRDLFSYTQALERFTGFVFR